MAEISPLRRRMIEDMTVRNLSPATQQSHLNAVSKFSRYFGRSPVWAWKMSTPSRFIWSQPVSRGLRSTRSSALSMARAARTATSCCLRSS
jgi:hypothetical protein